MVAPAPTVTGATSSVPEPMNIIADNRSMFIGTIVITSDGPSANVYASTDVTVTDMGQMIRFGTIREVGFFHFNKIADLNAAPQIGLGLSRANGLAPS